MPTLPIKTTASMLAGALLITFSIHGLVNRHQIPAKELSTIAAFLVTLADQKIPGPQTTTSPHPDIEDINNTVTGNRGLLSFSTHNLTLCTTLPKALVDYRPATGNRPILFITINNQRLDPSRHALSSANMTGFCIPHRLQKQPLSFSIDYRS
jgi:hypothetical protein